MLGGNTARLGETERPESEALSSASKPRSHDSRLGSQQSEKPESESEAMREKNKARLGETERLESASSQRQSNALKLGFRAGRPAVTRILVSAEIDNLDRG